MYSRVSFGFWAPDFIVHKWNEKIIILYSNKMVLTIECYYTCCNPRRVVSKAAASCFRNFIFPYFQKLLSTNIIV